MIVGKTAAEAAGAVGVDRRSLLLSGTAAAGWLTTGGLPVPQARAAGNVPPARLARLARGVQFTRQFEHYTDPVTFAAQMSTMPISTADLDFLKSAGITTCRVAIGADWILRQYNPVAVRRELFRNELGAFIDQAIARDFAVQLCFMADNVYKNAIDRAGDYTRLETDLVEIWTTLIDWVGDRSAEHLFLELMNEPTGLMVAVWPAIQARTAALIRARLPHHTLIATGGHYSSLDGLEALTPLADGNVVYCFHCYEPHVFVNQGVLAPVGDLAYPTDPSQRARVMAAASGRPEAGQYQAYFDTPWNAGRVHGLLARGRAWADRHGVPVIVNEFGVSQPVAGRPATDFAAPASRSAFFRDVRQACEGLGLPWGIYGYDDPWGLATTTAPPLPTRQFSPAVFDALGLANAAAGNGLPLVFGWNPLAAAENGWWWNPEAGGMGIAFEQKGGRGFAAVFFFDDDGAPIWHSGGGNVSYWGSGPGSLGTGTALMLDSFRGGTPFSGSYRTAQYVGNATYFNLVATGPRAATLNWRWPSIALQRFAFVANGPDLSPPEGVVPETGWWWVANEPGWGIFLEVQGNAAFLAVFTYEDDGRPVWFVGQGSVGRGELSVVLQRYRNGPSGTNPTRPLVPVADIGTIAVVFADRRTGQAVLPSGRRVALTRFVF